MQRSFCSMIRQAFVVIQLHFNFFPIHRTYFCVRLTDSTARIYYFPLFISPRTYHLMVEDYSRACQRDREVRRKKKKKKAQKKTLRRDRDLNPRTLSPEPSMLSIRPQRPALYKIFLITKCILAHQERSQLTFLWLYVRIPYE